jgi:hypothetical protein
MISVLFTGHFKFTESLKSTEIETAYGIVISKEMEMTAKGKCFSHLH